MDLIGDAKAASAITCITRSSHPAQNLKLRRCQWPEMAPAEFL
jgi:hypothetical protein